MPTHASHALGFEDPIHPWKKSQKFPVHWLPAPQAWRWKDKCEEIQKGLEELGIMPVWESWSMAVESSLPERTCPMGYNVDDQPPPYPRPDEDGGAAIHKVNG